MENLGSLRRWQWWASLCRPWDDTRQNRPDFGRNHFRRTQVWPEYSFLVHEGKPVPNECLLNCSAADFTNILLNG